MAMAVRWRDRPADRAEWRGGTKPRLGRRSARWGRATGLPAFEPLPDWLLVAGGSVLQLRGMTALDGEALRHFYLGLSRQTLYRRFMTPTPRLPESMLASLCETGRLDREVVVATLGDQIVAEARYHRVPGADEAEIALVVADLWQGRGIGAALTDRLARLGRRRGIVAFTGAMLADNAAARGLLGSAAPSSARSIRSGELEFRASLAAAP
ncbi:MAG TPA: GNAT family N-acetyltransferase [Actinomycetota bacterium]|nr:GNAT family N-acetyltransferase [Actinomycetota bacterium]